MLTLQQLQFSSDTMLTSMLLAQNVFTLNRVVLVILHRPKYAYMEDTDQNFFLFKKGMKVCNLFIINTRASIFLRV